MKTWTKCPLCGSARISWRTCEEIVRFEDGTKNRFAAAPHHHCAECGENFYDFDAAETVLGKSRHKAA